MKGIIGLVAFILFVWLLLFLAAEGVFSPFIPVECTDFGKPIGYHCPIGGYGE